MDVTLSMLGGGLPFLSPTFETDRLLAACVARRSLTAEALGLEAKLERAEGWLNPALALDLRRQEGFHTEIRNIAFEDRESDLLTSVVGEVKEACPEWRGLLALPVVVRKLREAGVISCSCYAVPQHVFLSDRCFQSRAELAEQFLHEMAHNWMYLIEEIAPFHDITWTQKSALPSGSRDCNPTELIGAAHVAATLGRWYKRDDGEPAMCRRRDLASYHAGCLEILDGLPSGVLTTTGSDAYQTLVEAGPLA